MQSRDDSEAINLNKNDFLKHAVDQKCDNLEMDGSYVGIDTLTNDSDSDDFVMAITGK